MSGTPRRAGRAAVRADVLRRAATRLHSPRSGLPLQIGESERPEELHLVPELDRERLVHPTACLGHQRDAVAGAGTVSVLDEVRVARRDERAANPVALETARLDQAPRP